MSQRARQQRDRVLTRRRTTGRVAATAAALALVGVALLALAALLRPDGSDGPAGAVDGALRVSMTEFAFDPDPIVLARGGARLEVVNDGTVAHDLVIRGLGKGTPDLPVGQRMVLDLSDQPAGTYEVVCDLPGHTEAGMVTELTIE